MAQNPSSHTSHPTLRDVVQMLQQNAKSLNQVAVQMERLTKKYYPPVPKKPGPALSGVERKKRPPSPLWTQLNPLLAKMVEKLRHPDAAFYFKLSQPDMAFFKKMYRRNVAGLEYLECQYTVLSEEEQVGWTFTDDEKAILQTLIPAINRLGPDTFFGNLTHDQAQSICSHLLELRNQNARSAEN